MKLPKIAENSIIYIVFSVLQKAINFFLLPLYTIYLTPEDYGITNVLTSATALLSLFFTFSIQAASSRFHYKFKKNEQLVRKIWGTNLIFIIINSLLLTGVIIVLYDYTLVYLIGNEIDFNPYVLVSILNCCFSPIFQYFQTYLQTEQKSQIYVVNSLGQFLLTLVLTLWFVVGLRMSALGVLLATMIANFVFAIISILSMRKYVLFSFSFKIIKKSLAYSIPLLPHSLSGWLNGMLDRLFINKLINLANVGLYSIGSQFGMIIGMIGMGVNQAYSPWFFSNHNTQSGRLKIREFSDVSIVAISAVGLLMSFFSPEILSLMTAEQYHSVWPTIVLFVFANLFDFLYKFYVAVLFLEKTAQLSIITITSSIISCFINVVLIKNFGYIGAAATYLFVQFSVSVIVLLYAKHIRPDIEFGAFKHYLEIVIPFIITLITLYSFENFSMVYRIMIKLIIYLICLCGIIFVNRNSIIPLIKTFLRNEPS